MGQEECDTDSSSTTRRAISTPRATIVRLNTPTPTAQPIETSALATTAPEPEASDVPKSTLALTDAPAPMETPTPTPQAKSTCPPEEVITYFSAIEEVVSGVSRHLPTLQRAIPHYAADPSLFYNQEWKADFVAGRNGVDYYSKQGKTISAPITAHELHKSFRDYLEGIDSFIAEIDLFIQYPSLDEYYWTGLTKASALLEEMTHLVDTFCDDR